MIAPKISLVKNGQILTSNLVNHIIARIEYGARLLAEYKPVAGKDIYVEPHYDGTRISYLVPVGGGAGPKGGGVVPSLFPYRVTMRSSAMDAGEELTWGIDGQITSAQLLPFPGSGSTRARMSGNLIYVEEGDESDRRFLLVINGKNLNNFSITKGGSQQNGTIIDVLFERNNGTAFWFTNFCGEQQTEIGLVEASGYCYFYPYGTPPGSQFDGVGNYWLLASGASMTFRVITPA